MVGSVKSPAPPAIERQGAPANLAWIRRWLRGAPLLAFVLPSILAALAPATWAGDMVTFFRPQFAAAALVALVAAGFARSGLWTAAALFVAVLNVYPLIVPSVRAAPTAEAGNFKLLSWNVLVSNHDPAAFVRFVAETAPDIVVGQETLGIWPSVFAKLPGYPYVAGQDVIRWNGIAVASRYPITASPVPGVPAPTEEVGGDAALRVEVHRPGATRPLVVFAIHAPTPRTLKGFRARNAYLGAVSQAAAAEKPGTDVIVAGDWNTPVWSPAYGRFLGDAGLSATDGSAWPAASRIFLRIAGFVLVGSPIDHIAVSAGVRSAGSRLGPQLGSDHRPVIADLALPS